jgi:hypothetical protein
MLANKIENSANCAEPDVLEQPLQDLTEFQLLLVGGGIGETCV